MFGTPAYGGTLTDEDVVVPVVKDKNVKVIKENTAQQQEYVKGVSLSSNNTSSSSPNEIASSTNKSVLESIQKTQEMAIVKNTSVQQLKTGSFFSKVTYSTWYERIIFKSSYYIDFIYKLLLLIIAFALVTMVLIEIRKQHYIHIMYGIFLILLLTAFTYINQSFF